jgi:hypothetical protein
MWPSQKYHGTVRNAIQPRLAERGSRKNLLLMYAEEIILFSSESAIPLVYLRASSMITVLAMAPVHTSVMYKSVGTSR